VTAGVGVADAGEAIDRGVSGNSGILCSMACCACSDTAGIDDAGPVESADRVSMPHALLLLLLLLLAASARRCWGEGPEE